MSDSSFFCWKTLSDSTSSFISALQTLTKPSQSRLVSPPVKPGFLRNALLQTPPQNGCTIEELIQDTKEHIYPGTTLWQSQRFFGYFPSTIAMTNILGQIVATTFHSPAFSYAISPSHTELENIVVDWSVLALGLPEKYLIQGSGGSIINNSTTQSVLVTVHVAKRKKMREIGIDCSPDKQSNLEKVVKLVGYFGDFGFMGNERGLKMKEIFYTRAVPSKYSEEIQNLVIDTEAFEKLILKDIENGLIPFWYGASYGTTFSCANDVNQETIRICQKYGIWMNVDAAYLGSSWICPQLRPNMKLFESVNSITVNFSKGLFLGTGGSVLYIADKKQIIESFGGDLNFGFFKNEYSGKDNVIDYKDWILGLNRRNNSIKFYYLFRHYGLEKLRQFVRYTVKRAEHVELRVKNSGIFKLFSKPQFGLVCFQLCDKNGQASTELTKKLVAEIRNIKEGFLTPGIFKEYYIVRISIGNESSTIEVIDRYLDVIEAKGRQIQQDKQKEGKNG